MPPDPRAAARHEFHQRAAGGLGWFALVVGAMLASSGALQWAIDLARPLSLRRTLFGALLTLLALAVLRARQRRPQLASGALIAGTQLIVFAYAWSTGLGLDSVMLAGDAVLVVLTGALLSPAAATALAGLHVAMAFAISRLVPGEDAPERLVSHALLAGAALAAALVLSRLLSRGLQEALAQRHRLDTLLRLGSDWAWELDRHGRPVFLSSSFGPLTGHAAAPYLRLGEPGGATVREDAEHARLRQALRERGPFRDRVVTFDGPDGAVLSVHASGEPLRDAAGRFAGWWGVGRNVTGEVAARRTLTRSRALLDSLVRHNPDPMFVESAGSGTLILVNEAFVAFAGRPERELLGRRPEDLLAAPDVPLGAQLRAVLAGQGPVRNLRTQLRVGGELRDLLVTAAAFEWDGQDVIVCTLRDISAGERTRAEVEAVLAHAPLGIATARAGVFQRVNAQFEQMLGERALAGRSVAETFLRRLGVDGAALEAAREPIDVECELAGDGGGRRALRVRARALDAAGAPGLDALWVIEDVTERRRAQAELSQARQDAEAASRAKSAFLASMSHEIRTPLNGVLGLARQLRHADLPEAERRQYVAHLVAAGELLSGLVNDVLDMSKIEAGELHLEHIAFDVRESLLQAYETFRRLGEARGLAFACHVDAALPAWLWGDPVRVRQIVANFLSNAVKFTQQGRVELALRWSGAALRVEVRDTGVGVPPQAAARLFRAFSQGDASTARRYGGTGLGLAICRNLAERMGGRVGVDSAGAGGSTFWAELPLRPAPGPQLAPAPPPEAALHGLTVLVAEDNEVNMLVTGALLRRAGVEVVEAADGLQAIDAVRRLGARLDVVLMDLHMPDCDGLEATRRIRAGVADAPPIVGLSAAVLDSERQAALDAGMRAFLSKPIDEAELRRVIAEVVPRR